MYGYPGQGERGSGRDGYDRYGGGQGGYPPHSQSQGYSNQGQSYKDHQEAAYPPPAGAPPPGIDQFGMRTHGGKLLPRSRPIPSIA